MTNDPKADAKVPPTPDYRRDIHIPEPEIANIPVWMEEIQMIVKMTPKQYQEYIHAKPQQ